MNRVEQFLVREVVECLVVGLHEEHSFQLLVTEGEVLDIHLHLF